MSTKRQAITNIQRIDQLTISKTLKRSIEILENRTKNPTQKKIKSVRFPILDTALYEWFLNYQDKVSISGEIIKEKANEFLIKLYPGETMSFTNGWLESFKNRYNIKAYTKHGE
ncbi:3343_t:CDS:2, partial [Acaulospora morrowiae]